MKEPGIEAPIASLAPAGSRARAEEDQPSRGVVLPAGMKVAAAAQRRRRKRNPFGRLAGLRISKKNYDRRKAGRFKKGFQKWIPHLTAWDTTLRLIASEARIRRRFKPGFVLDDELLGLTTASSGGRAVVYIHPDRLAQVAKAHKQRPLAIAAYLHGVACHELTHLDGRMGEGHSEEFVAAREDLGHATGHLLPAIAILVAKLLRLTAKPSEDQRRVVRLERQLERTRASGRSGKQALAQVAKLELALVAAQAEFAEALAESKRVREACGAACPSCCNGDTRVPMTADRVLEAAVAALRSQPPAGVDRAYLDAFVTRHHPHLRGLVRGALDRRAARVAQ